ncbi:hypothetical protein NMG60_11012969 [Bertholletia excelsa]
MSSRGGSSSNNGGGLQSIPAGCRKMVQSLKEIVNCPEAEIYAVLRECNMDPNEAVNRLLSQDPFREVKSKREKKKENKDTSESRSRGINNSSSRGGRGGTDRYAGRGGPTQYSPSDSSALHGKSAHKKENGTNNHTSHSSMAFGVAGNNINRRLPSLSDTVMIENKVTAIGTADGILSSSQPSSGYHAAWSGAPVQISMADVVKMGRPHGKSLSMANSSQYSVDHHNVQAPQSNASHYSVHSYEDYVTNVSEINPVARVASGQHVSPSDEWPLVEQPPAANILPVSEQSMSKEVHVDASHLSSDIINQHTESLEDEVQTIDDTAIHDINVNQAGLASVSSRRRQEDSSGSGSLFNTEIYKNIGSYQPHTNAFESHEVEDAGVSVSSVTSNLQQLSVQEDREAPPEDDTPSVIIPDHLQVQSADCAHLSFGSFRSGVSAAFSGPMSTMSLKSDMEEASADIDAASVGHLEARNPEYYSDEPLRAPSDGNLNHVSGATAGSYGSPSASQPEVSKQEHAEAQHDSQYVFPSSSANYNFENGQQLNAVFPHSQTNSQMQNLAPFSNQAYTSSLPSSLLAAGVQPIRESDIPYSPFPMTQSMPTKYGTSVSSISGSTISMPEAFKTVGFSSAHPTAPTLPGSSIATGPALPQHLPMHPYSQPTLPLGPFANMISYPFLPQSYTYMPSAFQQAFGGNQSLAAMLPQYKNSISVSSLPQSAAIASGYGGFGNSTSIPGNFSMNLPAAPGATTIGYDDVISSQYKDNNHLMSLQQNDNSGMWLHGPSSRTISAVPGSTYYSFQGQNQQPSGFRQSQQPSQNYGALGYPNFYHSQSGISLEHQQQNSRDGPLVGSQGQPPKQSQQIWQNSY